MKMMRFPRLFVLMLSVAGMAACGTDTKKDAPEDTLSSGTIEISADETYRPVIEEQKKVFDSSFPDAHVTINYRPESDCFNDLISKKARLILVTRALTAQENQAYLDRKMKTTSLDLARDGIAIVTSLQSKDSVFVLPQLVGMLTGTYKDAKKIVFDDAGSSTVRFIQDSILKGQKLGANVFGAKTADSVIAYVKADPNAIGFVGMPYVFDGTEDFRKDVRVGALKNDSTGEFLKPYQAYVALRTYPLTRTLYYISRESYPGLGTGFANFLAKERGQLIFKSFGMFPLRMNIVIRDANVNGANL